MVGTCDKERYTPTPRILKYRLDQIAVANQSVNPLSTGVIPQPAAIVYANFAGIGAPLSQIGVSLRGLALSALRVALR
jgi:hypothetical protein